MSITILLLIAVIAVALAFEFINGFHDCANAIATVVSTKVLSPKQAVLFGASLEFIGALTGTHVAKTIGSGIVNGEMITLTVIFCALLAAVLWNLFTWWLGLPSSSSHALIGGLLGATIVKAGFSAVHFNTLMDKVIIPMFTSPVLGFCAGFMLMLLLAWIIVISKAHPDKVNKKFRKLQLLSSGLMALSHGSNDAQKTMGIITLALMAGGVLHKGPSGEFEIPIYVILACAITMAAGTMNGGWKIIKTMGHKIIRLKPIHGFAAETSAAGLILTASHFGIPLSTTHVISTAIMGVGSTLHAHAVKWKIVGNIVTAWIVTIPACMILSSIIYYLIYKII
ncbi:inorganic phosphate transporter [bacterium]|uniref:Inorganic phosphate transporter n=1 Tax=Candidatus Scatenecus faecavium TaxID=2840915 RepID=A0A9D1FXD1_9BACT|nr:inorganic phosphate transporter [bacterium]HIS83161.1 inorganic phosphate transporter [Candidatus Scatenecus faecavium]